MRSILILSLFLVPTLHAEGPTDLFTRGEGISFEGVIPANERGIHSLCVDDKGRIFGGTTGRAAHFFVYDPANEKVRSLLRLPGGVALHVLRLDDGSFLAATQADPTGIAVATDPAAVGQLYRLKLEGDTVKKESLGIAVEGQGIHALAYLVKKGQVVGNTWPDGHFFALDLATNKVKDHGAIAGHRTFENPRYGELINKSGGRKVNYPRQVSRAIAVVGDDAYTGGALGQLYRYEGATGKLTKSDWKLPAVPGRETWASLDAVASTTRRDTYTSFVGGTSDGFLFEMRLDGKSQLRSRGKAFSEPGIQGLVLIEQASKEEPGKKVQTIFGVAGRADDMPRGFALLQGGGQSSVHPGGIPRVDGLPSMNGFGAMVLDGKGNLYAGERDRIARLVRYPLEGNPKVRPVRKPAPPPNEVAESKEFPPLDGHVAFAPVGTTTEASGYTAIEVGKDGQVYVGAARYGDYGYLLRFDPAKKPLWMDKVVSLRELTGERREGINTQGKIHAKIVVGADGKVWFASKQAHEIFDTRPEFEDPDGYPGGHLCYFDPKTGFSKSLGILKRQEGLMAGAIDDARGKLYYRSEPKNNFLVYDIKTGEVRDRGHLGNLGRYMGTDDKGRVYLVGRGNVLCCYDPATDYVEDLPIEVKGEGGYQAPYVMLSGPNGKLYGIGSQHPSIMEFTPEKDRVTMKNVGPTAPKGMPTLDIHSAVFGKDGKLYYPLVTSLSDPKKRGERFLLMMRFDPKTAKTEVIGKPRILNLDEDKVRHSYTRENKYAFDHTQGAAVSEDGSIYVLDIYPQLNVVYFPKLSAPR